MSVLADLVKEDFGISGHGRWLRSEVHSSLVVDAENDLYFFNARNLRGNTKHYLMNVRNFSAKMAEEFLKRRVSSKLPEFLGGGLQQRYEKLVDLFYESGKSNRDYWYRKGLFDSTIDRYRLGYFDEWYMIPIYDNGLFINFQCRRDMPNKAIRFWYKDMDFKPVLYNADILKFVDIAYVTEGMVDCILLNQLGLPSVCSTNGALSWNSGWIKYFTKIKNIFYIADNDTAGVSGAERASQFLGSRVRILRFKDKEEKYGALNYFKDGGTVDGFKEILNTNSVFGFEKELI